MIRFDNASFHYGGETGTGEGVDNINLSINDGEVIVFCGRSGCGKTTLTRMINGLAPHFYPGEMEGAVYVDDINVSQEELSVTSRYVGSVFQNPKSQFFNVDTTGELAFGCENQGMAREEIHRRIDKTRSDMKLDALMERNIFELSGGEKQQIACGSVYTADPKVYGLDEPSSNLDKKAIVRLHEILAKIKSAGRTIVVSEHRLYYLMDLADRFLYVDDGRITKSFTPDELRSLTENELSALGLRCTDLGGLYRKMGADIRTASLHDAERFSVQPVLEAIDLGCVRGNTQILDIERLSFPDQSIIAMIGDNGCGKSTLSETLCGVLPSDGTISFAGTYLTDKERATRSYLVMQDVNRQLFSESVLEEVMLNSPASEEEARQILSDIGLESVSERHPASLSGGQKQRVAIAAALCAGKDVIFYDEPTSGLDRGGMERFGDLLHKMQGRIRVSVIVTHDPELIMQCCTHICHVENGRILAFYPLNEEGESRVRSYFLSESEESISKKREHLGMFSKIMQYAGEWKKSIYWSIILLILGAICNVAPFYCIYDLIEKVIDGKPVTLSGSVYPIAAVIICQILYAFFYIGGLQVSHRAAFHTLENLRCHLQERMESQPLGHVLDMGTGAVKKLFDEDVESIEKLLAHMLPEGIANVIVAVVTLLIMVYVDWQITLLTLLMVGMGMAASSQMYKAGMDRMGNYFAAAKRLNNTIIEYVNGMEVVRVFNRQGEAGEKFKGSVINYRDFALAWYHVCWPWMALHGTIFSYTALYSIPFGALMIVLGHLTLRQYVLALCMSFAVGPLLSHVMSFLGAVPQINYKIQALEKALDHPPLKCGDQPFSGADHTVSFENVRFAYKSDEVLKGLSFEAKEGEMTALVGESGSGKSTIARLIAHYYDISQGVIRIGGQNIREISLDTLNHQIAYVSQELFLYNKSLLENIRIGKPDATDEEVKVAARKAQCEEFILALPNGYDTPAGTAGNALSGGQRQRIAFARAILKDAPIIVLDEATAFIDPENEHRMNEAIGEIIRGKTLIVIAHKLSSIINANKIVFLEHGRVSIEGTHSYLLEHCEGYRKLWNASSKTEEWLLKNDTGTKKEVSHA